MDIAKVSMTLAADQTNRNFGIGMLRKSMDQMEQMGNQVTQMMQEMAQMTGTGLNVDIRL